MVLFLGQKSHVNNLKKITIEDNKMENCRERGIEIINNMRKIMYKCMDLTVILYM